MEDRPEPSLIRDLRENYGGEYRLASLWNDRRRILDDPSVALQPGRGLVNSPIRFAMTLSVVPLLLASWLMAQLAGLLAPDSPTAEQSAVAEFDHVLQTRLHGKEPAALRELRARFKGLPEPLRALAQDARAALYRLPDIGNGALGTQQADEWLRTVDATPMQDEERDSLLARVAMDAHVKAKTTALRETLFASMMQGGAVADALFALSFLLGAWLFRRMVRRDPRFVHAAYADRFYLYYVTSRLFWWAIPLVPLFGMLSYAHATGQLELMSQVNIAESVLGLASTAYLLLCSGEMARALSGGPGDRGTTWSLAWRMIVSMLLSWVSIMIIVAFAMFALLTGYTVWLAR